MAIPADDHMVVDGDAKQVANFDDLLGHVDVGTGRGGVAGRVVVDEDAAGGVQFDGSPQAERLCGLEIDDEFTGCLPSCLQAWPRRHRLEAEGLAI
jgi:hypothetical protein